MSQPSLSPPQMSVRAVILSIVLAMILAAANTYLGLFAGLTIASAIPAAVVSMGVLGALGRAGHPREQHRVDGRLGGLLDRLGHHLHPPGTHLSGLLEGVRLLVGGRHRRPRRPARRALFGAAAPLARRRAEDELPGRPGGRRSAPHRRESVAGPQDSRRFRRRGRPDETDCRERSAPHSGHCGLGVLLGQGHRLLRHQPFTRVARRRLHRRPQYRRGDARGRRDRVEHRDPDLRGVLLQSRPGAGPGHRGRLCGRSRGRAFAVRRSAISVSARC